MLLPAGVGVQMVRLGSSNTAPGRYAGFNEANDRVARVVLFDGAGRLDLTPFQYAASDGNGPTPLGVQTGLTANPSPMLPELGFVLFDRPSFMNQFSLDDADGETEEERWLDENGTLLLLSRYSGTFVQGGR